MVTVADLVEYRRRHEKLVDRGAVRPAADGVRRVHRRSRSVEKLTGKVHVALVLGDVDGRRERPRPRPLRVPHRATSSTRSSATAASSSSRRSRRSRARAAACCSTWRRRGAGSACSTSCAPTRSRRRGSTRSRRTSRSGFPADAREYGIGNQILADLGLTTIRILTNNPKKLTGLDGFGLTVVEQMPIEVVPNDENRRYLAAKRDKLGHRLHHQGLRINPEWDERRTEKDG